VKENDPTITACIDFYTIHLSRCHSVTICNVITSHVGIDIERWTRHERLITIVEHCVLQGEVNMGTGSSLCPR
jgi:hypothetical protein